MTPAESAAADDAIARQRVASGRFAHPPRRRADEPRRVALVVEIPQHAALQGKARHRRRNGLVERVFEIIPDRPTRRSIASIPRSLSNHSALLI
jgi:hypothetical protein